MHGQPAARLTPPDLRLPSGARLASNCSRWTRVFCHTRPSFIYVVGAFDVIEHVLEDEVMLQNFHRAIKPGGGCLITAHQHQWLWNSVDDAACHQRRCSAKELQTNVEAAGFRIVRSTSFDNLLLPLMLAFRVAARRSGQAGGGESLTLNPLLDRTLEAIMGVEHILIRYGVSLPIGGSRLVILRRKETT